MKIKTTDLENTNCMLKSVKGNLQMWDGDNEFNCEEHGREGHLLFYLLDNEVTYFENGTKAYVLKKNDIIFLPSGSKYTSKIKKEKIPTRGIGIVFELVDESGGLIEIDSPIKILAHDSSWYYYKRFYDICISSLRSCGDYLKRKANTYSLLNDLFASSTETYEFEEAGHDIFNAIYAIEYTPEIKYSNEQLAKLCFMSTSSFLRKFKQYSGGITPMQYRNNIRIFKAEEMSNSSLTIDEIAQRLGFYDAAHFCKFYKHHKGHAIKSIEKNI